MSQAKSVASDLDRLDLEEVRQFLVRRWKLIAAATLAFALLALAVCLATTPVFTATSQLLLDPRKDHVFGTDTVSSDVTLDSSIVDSQIPVILSTRLLAKVVTKEDLSADPEFAASAKQGLLSRILGLFRAQPPKPAAIAQLDGIDPKIAPVVVHLFSKVDVTRVAKSNVLAISVSSRDAAKAARLANTIAQTYIEDQVDVRTHAVQQAASFFEERLGDLRQQVQNSERAVAEFRKAHNLATTVMDGPVTVSEQQLQDLNQQLALATTDTAEKLARYQQASRFRGAGGSLDELPEVIRSGTMSNLRTQQADLARREADLSAMYGPSYPAITQIRAQRTGFDRAIANEVKRLVAGLKNDYDIAKVREDALRKTIVGLSDASGGDNDVGVKLRELERTNLANKALFENFLKRAKLTQEQSSFEDPEARVISPALEPSAPSSPKTKLIVPVAAVLGLIAGLGLAALLDWRRRGQAAPFADAGGFVLARIAGIDAQPGRRIDERAFMDHHPTSAFTRSVEGLASTIAGSLSEGAAIAFASLAPGDGASTVARCVADSLGRRDLRVLLIEGGPGRGQAERRTRSGKAADAIGLGEVLAGEASAGRALKSEERFTLMPAGLRRLAGADRERLRTFLSEAKQRYDVVVLDAPVFAADPERDVLVSAADRFALVASRENLLRDAFVRAVDAAGQSRAFLGIVLNRSQANAGAPYAWQADARAWCTDKRTFSSTCRATMP